MKREILKSLIECNTVKDLENEKIREVIKKYLKNRNFTFEEIGEGNKKVLCATRGENAKLGFVSHTDTVSSSKYWTYPAFTLTEDKDYYIGLGVCDMKGGLAGLLCAINEVDSTIPLVCYFTYDEEIGFEGIKTLVHNKQDFPDTLIFPEPTDLVPIIATKGCMEFTVTLYGKSAHSGTPNLGVNAIMKGISFIKELEEFAHQLEQEENKLFQIPYTTFNLGMINGGTAFNQVPDTCTVSFDFRTISKEQEMSIIETVTTLCNKYDAKLDIINQVSCASNENGEFKQLVEQELSMPEGASYVTEASFFEGKNILILGPGPNTSHEQDESILKSSYDKTIEIYQKIITNWGK